jgi:hypothetical protein
MAETESNKLEKKPMNKWLFAFLLTVVSVFFIVFCFLLCYSDPELDDFSDLLPTEHKIPEEENAHTHLLRAIDAYDKSTPDKKTGVGAMEGFLKRNRISIIAKVEEDIFALHKNYKGPKRRGRPRNPPTPPKPFTALCSWEEYFASKEKVFEEINKSFACRLNASNQLNFDDDLPSLMTIRDISRLYSLKAQWLRKQNKHQEALTLNIDIIRLGTQLAKSEGQWIYFMIALAIQGTGAENIMRLLELKQIPYQELKKYQETITANRPSPIDLINSFKNEFSCNLQVMDHYSSANQPGFEFEDDAGFSNWGRKFDYFFRPNLNKNEIADGYRQYIELLKSDAFVDLVKLKANEYKSYERSGFEQFIRGNYIGDHLASMMVASKVMAHRQLLESINTFKALEIQIAALGYIEKHGEAPNALKDLEKEFLSPLPKDSFTYKDFIYQKDIGFFYSLGKNLEDDGGLKANDVKEFHINSRRRYEDNIFQIFSPAK